MVALRLPLRFGFARVYPMGYSAKPQYSIGSSYVMTETDLRAPLSARLGWFHALSFGLYAGYRPSAQDC